MDLTEQALFGDEPSPAQPAADAAAPVGSDGANAGAGHAEANATASSGHANGVESTEIVTEADLFGEDSDQDQAAAPPLERPRDAKASPQIATTEIDVDAEPPAASQAPSEADLFGDGSDVEDAQGNSQANDAAIAKAATRGVTDEESQTKLDKKTSSFKAPPVVAKGDNAAITIPFLPRPTMDSQLAFVRLPTALRVETTPFIKAIWQGDNDPAFANIDAARKSTHPVQNVIRWRLRENADGSVTRESNARLVKWSDGSQQLLVGVEALDMTPRAMDPQIHFLYAAYPDSNPDVPSSRRRAKRSRSRTGGDQGNPDESGSADDSGSESEAATVAKAHAQAMALKRCHGGVSQRVAFLASAGLQTRMQEALRTQNTERVSREPKVKVVVAIEEIERKREEKLQAELAEESIERKQAAKRHRASGRLPAKLDDRWLEEEDEAEEAEKLERTMRGSDEEENEYEGTRRGAASNKRKYGSDDEATSRLKKAKSADDDDDEDEEESASETEKPAKGKAKAKPKAKAEASESESGSGDDHEGSDEESESEDESEDEGSGNSGDEEVKADAAAIADQPRGRRSSARTQGSAPAAPATKPAADNGPAAMDAAPSASPPPAAGLEDDEDDVIISKSKSKKRRTDDD